MMITGDQVEGAFFASILLGIGKLISMIRGDGNKRLDHEIAKQKLAIEADAQEAMQEKEFLPFLQEQVRISNERASKLEEKIEVLQKEVFNVAISLTEYKSINMNLETRIQLLEKELATSKAKNEEDIQTIATLKAQLEMANTRSEDQEMIILDLQHKIRNLEAKHIPAQAVPEILAAFNKDSIGPEPGA